MRVCAHLKCWLALPTRSESLPPRDTRRECEDLALIEGSLRERLDGGIVHLDVHCRDVIIHWEGLRPRHALRVHGAITSQRSNSSSAICRVNTGRNVTCCVARTHFVSLAIVHEH